MARSPTYLQLSLGIALGGSLLAVVVPSFVRDLHASRLSEAVKGLNDIGRGALAYARDKPPAEAFPPSAPLTPADVPRGRRVKDPPGTWDHMTWAALGYSIDHEHNFSFAFESSNGPERSTFVVRAHGDLDGDGERSTFELQGECTREGCRILPGLFVDHEVE